MRCGWIWGAWIWMLVWLGGCGTAPTQTPHSYPDDGGVVPGIPSGPTYDLAEYLIDSHLSGEGTDVTEVLYQFYLDATDYNLTQEREEVAYERLGDAIDMFVQNRRVKRYEIATEEITEHLYDAQNDLSQTRQMERYVQRYSEVERFIAHDKEVVCYVNAHYADIFEDVDVARLVQEAQLDDRRNDLNPWYYRDLLELSCVTDDPQDRVDMLFARGYGRVFSAMNLPQTQRLTLYYEYIDKDTISYR